MKPTLSIFAALIAGASLWTAPTQAVEFGPRLAPGDQARAQRPAKPRYDSKRVERSKTDNGRRKVTTWSRGDKSVSRDATLERDGNRRTRDVTYTDAQGRQANAEHTRTRSADGHTTHSVFTDRQGRQATRDASFQRTGDGSNRDVTYTGRDGKVRTVDDDIVRSENGRERTTVFTNAHGNSATRRANAYWDESSQTWVNEVSYSRNDDGE